jgi:hypothetical protein
LPNYQKSRSGPFTPKGVPVAAESPFADLGRRGPDGLFSAAQLDDSIPAAGERRVRGAGQGEVEDHDLDVADVQELPA